MREHLLPTFKKNLKGKYKISKVMEESLDYGKQAILRNWGSKPLIPQPIRPLVLTHLLQSPFGVENKLLEFSYHSLPLDPFMFTHSSLLGDTQWYNLDRSPPESGVFTR